MSILLRVLGPVFGFLAASKCLSYWIDPYESPNLSTKDPRWLGAWWIGMYWLNSFKIRKLSKLTYQTLPVGNYHRFNGVIQ